MYDFKKLQEPHKTNGGGGAPDLSGSTTKKHFF